MAEILFEADHASRSFANGVEVRAVVDACCRVAKGERIAIVGASGSGKSTLLNLMAGLDASTSGVVSWPAIGPASELRPRHVGIVFQSMSLMPALTSLENVELPLLLAGGRLGVKARAHEALSILELDDLADHLPEDLSGGQAQRVAMARAIAGAPRLLLADEPTGQLDNATGALLLDRVIAWAERSAAALVVATHDEAVATRMQRVWRMNHGRLDTTGKVA